MKTVSSITLLVILLISCQKLEMQSATGNCQATDNLNTTHPKSELLQQKAEEKVSLVFKSADDANSLDRSRPKLPIGLAHHT